MELKNGHTYTWPSWHICGNASWNKWRFLRGLEKSSESLDIPIAVEMVCEQTLTIWDNCYPEGSEQPNLNTQTSQSNTGHFKATKGPSHISCSCCTLKGTQNDNSVCVAELHCCPTQALLPICSLLRIVWLRQNTVCKIRSFWKKKNTEIQQNFTHLSSCQYHGSRVFCQEGSLLEHLSWI